MDRETLEPNETVMDKSAPGPGAGQDGTPATQDEPAVKQNGQASSDPAAEEAVPGEDDSPDGEDHSGGEDDSNDGDDFDDGDEDDDDLYLDSDEPQGGRMSLVGHLAELRKRLIICVGCFLVCFALCMTRAEWFTDLMLTRGSQFSFVYISPSELLMSYIRVALIGGLVVTIPVIIFQVWQFLKPGLRRGERLGFTLVMTLGLALFVLGAAFAFAIVLPILLGFFARLDTTNTVSAMISVESYISYVVSTMITFGIIFETPIVLVALTSAGLVKPQFLQKNFKFVVLVILAVSAVITPPDVTSQVLVAVPLMVLFYASIILCKILFRRKLAKEAAEEAELSQ